MKLSVGGEEMKVDTLIYIGLVVIVIGQILIRLISGIKITELFSLQIILLLIVDMYHMEQIKHLRRKNQELKRHD